MENACCLEEYYCIFVLLSQKRLIEGSFTLLFAKGHLSYKLQHAKQTKFFFLINWKVPACN